MSQKRVVSITLVGDGQRTVTSHNVAAGQYILPFSFATQGRKVTDIGLTGIAFPHVWYNVSAELGNNTLVLTIKNNGSNIGSSPLTMTVPDGDYTIVQLCAYLTTSATNSLSKTVTFIADWQYTAAGAYAATSEPNRYNTGKVHIHYNHGSANVSNSITVSNTALTRMLGFYRHSSDSALADANLYASAQYAAIQGAYYYDVRYGSLKGAMHLRVEGVPPGITVNGSSVNDRPLLCVIPVQSKRFGETVDFEARDVDMASQPMFAEGSGLAQNNLTLCFEWADGSAVDFKNATVSVDMYVVETDDRAFGEKRMRSM